MVEKLIKKAPVKLGFSFEEGMKIHFKPLPGEEGDISGAKKVLQALNG
jgi:hypothetical protein